MNKDSFKLYLIRHAQTEGNLLRKYIGCTDEPLCEKGIRELQKYKKTGRYPQCNYVFVSPLLRCLQTREIIYGGQPFAIVPEFRECNFGNFENKTFSELKDNPDYLAWLAGAGQGPIPGGEDGNSFRARCRQGFFKVLDRILDQNIYTSTLILHGGTIMAILQEYAPVQFDLFHWQVENCGGYELAVDENLWLQNRKIKAVARI